MIIKDHLTYREMIDRIQVMSDRYIDLAQNTISAVNNLDEIKLELQKARQLYEQSTRYVIKKSIERYPKFIVSMIFATCFTLIIAIASILKNKNVIVNKDSVQLEEMTGKSQS